MNNKIGFALFGGIGGLCLLIGGILLFFAIQGVQEQQRYLSGRCTVVSKQLLEAFFSNNSSNAPSYSARFVFTVQTADGHQYEANGYDGSNTYNSSQSSEQDILDSYSVGKTYTCWYDKTNPTHAVLARHPNWLLFIMSAVLFLVGIVFAFASFLMRLGRFTWVAVPNAGGYSWRGQMNLFGRRFQE